MPIVVFDLETGGLDYLKHPIIQLAAIALNDKFDEIARFERKVLFDPAKCDAGALDVNRYDADLWSRVGVSPAACACDFSRFLEQYRCVEKISKAGKPYTVARLAGHNASTFDGPFLRQMYGLLEKFLPADFWILDTVQMALAYSIRNGITFRDFKLPTLCEAFSLPLAKEDAHDALHDCGATAAILKAMLTA